MSTILAIFHVIEMLERLFSLIHPFPSIVRCVSPLKQKLSFVNCKNCRKIRETLLTSKDCSVHNSFSSFSIQTLTKTSKKTLEKLQEFVENQRKTTLQFFTPALFNPLNLS
jgi:DNA replication protein DnaC